LYRRGTEKKIWQGKHTIISISSASIFNLGMQKEPVPIIVTFLPQAAFSFEAIQAK
jgi:hypothetical protein